MEATTTFEGAVNGVRSEIKRLAKNLIALKGGIGECEVNSVEDRGEVMANLTLSYRHLEDASMRLGKVLQAYDGGVSVYDKATTVGMANK